MYERFYGFREGPFDLTPNPRYLYLTTKHREALRTLNDGLSSGKGVTLIVGQAGTGKTTLARAVLDGLRRPEHRLVHVNNPTLTRSEFFEMLASAFGLTAAAGQSKARFLVELEASILQRRAREGLSALIIDEAQSLPLELLEEVRLLANIETETEKLLPVVLMGQLELADRLERPEWAHLKQRVALRAELGPLDIRDTAAYIAGRIRIAGGDVTKAFTRDAVVAVFQHSRGIPRTISVICDNALVAGFAADARPVTRQIVLEVCRNFRLAGEMASGQAMPSPRASARAAAEAAEPIPARPPLMITERDEADEATEIRAVASASGGRPSVHRMPELSASPAPDSTSSKRAARDQVPPARQPLQAALVSRSAVDRRPTAEPRPEVVVKKTDLERQARRAKADATGADRDTLFGSYREKRKRRFLFF